MGQLRRFLQLLSLLVCFSLLARYVLYPFNPWADLQTSLFCALGDELLNLVFVHRITDNLLAGRSLFDGGFFFPYKDTLTFSENLLIPAVIYRLYYWITQQGILSYHLMLFTVLGANATAMYWVCRRYVSVGSSFIAGLIYAFSMIRLSQMSHIQLFPAWWYPLALLAAFRFYETPSKKRAAVLGLILVGQYYSGIYLGFMLLCAVLPLLAWMLWKTPNRRPLLESLAVVGLVLAALVGPMAYPYFAMSRTHGIVRDIDEARQYAAYFWSYFSTAPESIYGAWMAWGKNLHEKRLFAGFVALGLCFLAFRQRQGVAAEKRKLFLLSLGCVMWLSLGPNAVLYAILYFVLPGFKALRCPARFSMAYLLFVAIAAGFGTEILLRKGKKALIVFVLTALLLVDNHVRIPLVKVPTYLASAASYLTNLSDGRAVVHLPLRSPYGRFEGDQGNPDNNRETVRMYYSLFHGHPIANGYSGFTPRIFADLISVELSKGPSPELGEALKALDIKYAVVEKRMLPVDAELWKGWVKSHRTLFEDGEVWVIAL